MPVDVIFSRDTWNKDLRAKKAHQAKQDTIDLNEWCEKHSVKFETLPKRQVKAICPDAATALLFKMTWL